MVKDKEAWRAAAHGVAESQTQLSNCTTTKSKKQIHHGVRIGSSLQQMQRGNSFHKKTSHRKGVQSNTDNIIIRKKENKEQNNTTADEKKNTKKHATKQEKIVINYFKMSLKNKKEKIMETINDNINQKKKKVG